MVLCYKLQTLGAEATLSALEAAPVRAAPWRRAPPHRANLRISLDQRMDNSGPRAWPTPTTSFRTPRFVMFRDTAPPVRPRFQLSGPSTLAGTAHYAANELQAAATVGGTYAAERQVAAMALRAAGLSDLDIAAAIQRADAYFVRSETLLPTPYCGSPVIVGCIETLPMTAIEAAVRVVVGLLVQRKYLAVERVTRGRRLTSEQMATAISKYGRTLSSSLNQSGQVTLLPDATDRRVVHVAAPLRTVEEGRSDLSIELDLREYSPGLFDTELLDIRVM